MMQSRRRLLGVSFVAALFVLAAARIAGIGIGYNTTASMPIGWYLLLPSQNLATGDAVIACIPEPAARIARARAYIGPGSCPGGAGEVVKLLGAVSGARVSVTRQGVCIDGRLLAASRPAARDPHRRPLPRWNGGLTTHLGPREYWLTGADRLSWDSRYWGPVRGEAIRARALRVGAPLPSLQWRQRCSLGRHNGSSAGTASGNIK
ncbi:conjugal transfer protein TraF [bacterium]|nr:MAG: conjugal transfer protein TraF [bacterium]